ncbi:class A beta-lactamase-related serine hydrolase [Kitasatospora sp. NBC_01287]|uniref:serine hydrolase n=1 Tax=Kitasatospora sp. NBC_01287 TaxID=2903573 RepID=UPI002251402F|nr:serine hydrolase [Kitasatospora sp. NBC_01287]MCX4744324.1 class A beta-lactamase-related serine hydrolase [Kitasatospora sp. NBC_01287]
MTDDNTVAARAAIEAMFERAGCTGALRVQSLTDGSAFDLHGDEPVVLASVSKVLVALEAETWFAEGRLDPREPVTLPAAERTLGPTGLSLMADDVVLTWRDMVVLMLTISDNQTTDALLGRVGVDSVNATAARLGLTRTVLESDKRTMIDSIAQDLGRADWADLVDWAREATEAEMARADELLLSARALDPERGTRSTPREMAELLRLIWTDQAGPAAACARVRTVLGHQLTRHRLASGFRRPVRVAAKSGSLVGVVRNEIGVISYPEHPEHPDHPEHPEHPGGRHYAAAVFTRSRPGSDDSAISAAIGAAAARAVEALRAAAAGA